MFLCLRWLLNVTSVKKPSPCWTKQSSSFPLSSPWVSSSACSGKTICALCLFPNSAPCSVLSSFTHFCLCLPLRNKIALDPTQALFLLVAERSMSCMSSSMGEVYSRYSDTDGFLYITYASQEMFGAPWPPCWAWKQMKHELSISWNQTNSEDTTQPKTTGKKTHKDKLSQSWDCFCPVFQQQTCISDYLMDHNRLNTANVPLVTAKEPQLAKSGTYVYKTDPEDDLDWLIIWLADLIIYVERWKSSQCLSLFLSLFLIKWRCNALLALRSSNLTENI